MGIHLASRGSVRPAWDHRIDLPRLARALGETMAVTMVIGNDTRSTLRCFAPGYTIAAVIANEFTEATGDVYRAP